jgi:threonylcarbamoyladenosine tRNA methylthiotransferase CDKAL1
MADILNHPRVYKFLHVPVQSGSNKVLDKMNREYTVEEFSEVCDFLKEKVPNMIIATDIICGFPTETEEHHHESCELVRKY